MEKKYLKIAPSILAGDFGKLADEAKKLEESGADRIHIDVMDGHFVPNLTLGPRAVAAINRATNLFLEVHMMMYNPFDYVESFIESGADLLTIHFEATEEVEETLAYIRRCGVKAGLSIRPETSVTMLNNYLTHVDLILLMTVDPGFGGQAFMPEMLDKIRYTRQLCQRLNIFEGGEVIMGGKKEKLAPLDIEVDGGITKETAKLCVDAGATVLVSGTYLFKQPDMKAAIAEMRSVG